MAVINSSKFNLKEVVEKYLNEMHYEVVEEMTTVIPQVAKEAAKKLRSTSPKMTGEYARTWASKVEKGRLQVGAVVYAKSPGYKLAHLLEHGHATRNGGREKGKVEHIKPVEEWAIKEAEDRMIENLERKMR